MNQNPNGETKSPAELKTEQFEQLMAGYLASLKLEPRNPSKAADYLNMPEEVVQKLTSDACGEIAFTLSQYNLYIQKVLNQHRAMVKWADRNINYLIARDVEEHGGQYTPFEIKKIRAINENPTAKELFTLKSLADNNVSILEDIPRRVESMIHSLKELANTRRKQ